jgi:uncharacterized protein (DUF4415 family)
MASNLARLDATTDEEIARQIAEDPDTAPELTDEQLAEAEVYDGDRFVRRVGRPKGSGTKELVTLRIDRDVLKRFREGGPGWQTRLNEALQMVSENQPAPNLARVGLMAMAATGMAPAVQISGRPHFNPMGMGAGDYAMAAAVKLAPGKPVTVGRLSVYLRQQHGLALTPSEIRRALRRVEKTPARGRTQSRKAVS